MHAEKKNKKKHAIRVRLMLYLRPIERCIRTKVDTSPAETVHQNNRYFDLRNIHILLKLIHNIPAALTILLAKFTLGYRKKTQNKSLTIIHGGPGDSFLQNCACRSLQF